MNDKSVQQLLRDEWEIAENGGYFPKGKTYNYLPVISGCPKIVAEKYRPYIGRTMFSRQPTLRIKKAPKFAHIRKIINYPWRRMGSPQVCLKGNKGTGKTVLMNLLISFFLARGIRVLMFDNSRFESRNLAPHGYFDKQNEFHPYQIDVWIPTGYKFKTGEYVSTNPLWNHRDNVHRREYNDLDEIIRSMEPHKITVLYDECFTKDAKLKIFSDILTILAETARIDRNYMFAHNELASLIPENPTKDTYKLVQDVSGQIVNIRKDRIGLITCFHLEGEVFYRIVRKFSYICHKQPENKKQYTPVEEDALKLKISEVNISRFGYWVKHDIGYFPGLPDIFRAVPQREKLSYPSLEYEEPNGKDKKKPTKTYDNKDFAIMQLRHQGLSFEKISVRIGMSIATVHKRFKRLEAS